MKDMILRFDADGKVDPYMESNGHLTKEEFLQEPSLVSEFMKADGKILQNPDEAFENYALNAGASDNI